MTTPTDGLALPSTERPEPVTPRSRRRGWSLRAHLIAVVIIAIALVVLSGVLVISKDYRRARAEGVRNAKFEAGLAAGITGKSKTAGAESISGSLPDLRALIVRSGSSLGQVTNGNLVAYPPERCNLSFQSCERRAKAEVSAPRKRKVPVILTTDVKPIWIRKSLWIAICGSHHCDNRLMLTDLFSTHLYIVEC